MLKKWILDKFFSLDHLAHGIATKTGNFVLVADGFNEIDADEMQEFSNDDDSVVLYGDEQLRLVTNSLGAEVVRGKLSAKKLIVELGDAMRWYEDNPQAFAKRFTNE